MIDHILIVKGASSTNDLINKNYLAEYYAKAERVYIIDNDDKVIQLKYKLGESIQNIIFIDLYKEWEKNIIDEKLDIKDL